MGRKGLKGIDDPSKYLLKGIQEAPVSGSTVAACMEGLRPILIEVQALTVHSVLAVPRRIASGYDLIDWLFYLPYWKKGENSIFC